MLFYCALKEDRTEEFKDVMRLEVDLEMAFDYKVRNLTHIFLLQLVNKVGKIDDLKLIFIMEYCNVSNGYPVWRFDFNLNLQKQKQ